MHITKLLAVGVVGFTLGTTAREPEPYPEEVREPNPKAPIVNYCGVLKDYVIIADGVRFEADSAPAAIGGSFRGADFTEAKINSLGWGWCDFSPLTIEGREVRTTFEEAIFRAGQMDECTFYRVNFRNAQFSRTEFRHCDLRESDFRGAELFGARFTGTLSGDEGSESDSNLMGANFEGAVYDDETLWPARFDPKARGLKPLYK